MRPEYVQAVDAVRNGWSFWIIWILPACVIWISMLFRPFRRHRYRIAIVLGAFVLANFLFWYCTVSHAERIQLAKRANMQTAAEQNDWTSDTWRVFAPIFAIQPALAYCTINLAAAWLIRSLILYILKMTKSKSGVAVHAFC